MSTSSLVNSGVQRQAVANEEPDWGLIIGK
jgi:hypothetical protein